MVQNTSEGQKIYAKGLSDGTGREVGSGELYSSNDFLNAFKSFVDTLKLELSTVRYEGKNETHQQAIAAACDTLSNSITETSIIASS